MVSTVKKIWVNEKVKDVLRDGKKHSPSELIELLYNVHGVTVGAVMMNHSIVDIRNAMWEEGTTFGHLRSYLEALRTNNDGTDTCLVVEEGVFKRAFVALGMCVRAFELSTRVVGLDACHVKAKYGGVLLVMTVLDGDGSVFPAALAIAESENVNTWTWFLSQVQRAFSLLNGDGLVVLSDREKGIDIALRTLLPDAAHSFCVYHIQKNVKTAFHTTLDGLLFKAAKASSPDGFDEAISEMKALHNRAANYVLNIPKEKWARAFFPCRRFGHVTSNISESMNYWLEDARHFLPVGLFSVYVRKVNLLFEKRHQEYSSQPMNSLPKNVHEKLTKSVQQASTLRVKRNTRALFEVQRLNHPLCFRVVDIEAMKCSCRFFDEHGIPCRHICAAVLSQRRRPQDLIIHERLLPTLVAMYDGFTVPVDSTLLQDDGLKAPTGTKKRGRPKEKRIRSSAETVKKKVVCGRCGKRGHNSRTCRAEVN